MPILDSSVVVGLVGGTKTGGLLATPDTPFLAVTKNRYLTPGIRPTVVNTLWIYGM